MTTHNTRVQTDLVHDRNARLFHLVLQLQHCRRDIAGCNHVLLLPNRRLDDSGVKRVGNQTDRQICPLHLFVEGLFIVHVKGDGSRVLNAFAELLRTLECSAGYMLSVRCYDCDNDLTDRL
jgi:hypothetical protein